MTTTVASDLHYELITTVERLEELCEEFKEAEYLAVDTETEGLKFSDIIVGIALSHKPGHGYYIPMRHEAVDGIRYDNQVSPEDTYRLLGPVLETVKCVGHNVKFDLKMFWKDGIDVNYTDDTLVLAHILDVNNNGSRRLKTLVKKIFNHDMKDIDTLFPKVGNKKPDIKPKILAPKDIEFYGCEDGNWSLKLFYYLHQLLRDRTDQGTVYKLEMALLPVVSEMEAFGVPVSMPFLQDNSERAGRYLESLQEAIINEIRESLSDDEYEINLKSPSQLSTLLFDRLKLPVLKTSPKTGKPSTDASVMRTLAKMSPLVRRIMTYRDLEKLNNTYLKGLQDKVEVDGRIHGTFDQSGTASGRFASRSPNLQNLPKDQIFYLWAADPEQEKAAAEHFDDRVRKEGGKYEVYIEDAGMWVDEAYLGPVDGTEYGVFDGEMYEAWKCKTRSFIEAPKDHYLIEADYSQVELRIMAGESQEPTLLDAYNSGDDVHTRTAAVIFDIEPNQVSDEQRHVGKTINFSLLYGAGAYNISAQLGVEIEEAQQMVDRYFENLSAVKTWINRVKQDTRMDGYAETILKRRRVFPNVRSSDRKLAEKELRESVNHHIQGAAADVMKTALVRINKMLRQSFGDKVKIISTVHDSVLVECHNSCVVEDVLTVLKQAMEDITFDSSQLKAKKAGELRPDEVTVVTGWPRLIIDAKVGKSWGTSKDYSFEGRVDTAPKADVSGLPKVRVRQIAKEREASSVEDVRWVLHVPKPLQDKDVNYIKSFLSEREDDEGSSLTLEYVGSEGEVVSHEFTGTYNLDFSQEVLLKSRLGPCTLKQDIDALDYDNVLRGIDFGL